MDSKLASEAPAEKNNGVKGVNYVQDLEDFPPLGSAGEPAQHLNADRHSPGTKIVVPSCSGDVQAPEMSKDAQSGCPDSNNNVADAVQGNADSIQPSSSTSVLSLGGYSAPPPIYAHPQCYGLPVPFLGPHIPLRNPGSIQRSNGESGVTQQNEHPLSRVVEFRSDITYGTVLQPTYLANCPPPVDSNVFHPTDQVVVTAAESVVHYVNQPYTICVNGKWISGIAHLPLAHHICVCLDDGVRRYESITRIDLLCPEEQRKREVTGIQSREPYLKPVNYRIITTRAPNKPTFKKAIRQSLMELIGPYKTEEPYEICCTRQNSKYVNMDRHIDRFSTSKDLFQSYFFPIIHYAEQRIQMNLLGARYHFDGTIYRPFLKAATLLLSSGNLQLMDTVELKVCPAERRIYCLSYDTTIASKDEENGHVAINIIDSVSYVFEGKYKYWGPELVNSNARLPTHFHPFKNLDYNPFVNEGFNPYHTFSFQIPTHPTVPLAVPSNHYHGDYGRNKLTPNIYMNPEFVFSEHPNLSVFQYIGPAAREIGVNIPGERFGSGPIAQQLELLTASLQLTSLQDGNAFSPSARTSGSRLNPEAKEFNPRNFSAATEPNFTPIPEVNSFTGLRPFSAQEHSNMSIPAPIVGPIYLDPCDDSSDAEEEASFGNGSGSTTRPATSIESFGTLVGSVESTQPGIEQSGPAYGTEDLSGYSISGSNAPNTVISSPYPTIGITTSTTSWSEEMEAHSFQEYESQTYTNNTILIAAPTGSYDYNQVDDTGRPLRRAPSRDTWRSNGLSFGTQDWNQNESSSREWFPERPMIACVSAFPPQQWTPRVSEPPVRESTNSASRSHEWNPDGPPPARGRDWNRSGSNSREWNPDGPQAQEWRTNSGPGYFRGGGRGSYRNRYDHIESGNPPRNEDENRRGRNFGSESYRGGTGRNSSHGHGNSEIDREPGHGHSRRQEDSGDYGYSPPSHRGNYYGGRGRGGRVGGRGHYYNSYRQRERDEPNPNLILCSPRSSDIDVHNHNQNGPTSGRKEQKNAKTPRKNKKTKTPRTPRKSSGYDQDKPSSSGDGIST